MRAEPVLWNERTGAASFSSWERDGRLRLAIRTLTGLRTVTPAGVFYFHDPSPLTPNRFLVVPVRE